MPAKKQSAKDPVSQLERFLAQNPNLNLPSLNLRDEATIQSLKWSRLRKKQEIIVPLLQGYQRLSKLIPGAPHDIKLGLLRGGIQSALQIASLPKQVFFSRFRSLFGAEEALMHTTYQQALQVRSKVLLQFMSRKQNHEAHLNQSILRRSTSQDPKA